MSGVCIPSQGISPQLRPSFVYQPYDSVHQSSKMLFLCACLSLHRHYNSVLLQYFWPIRHLEIQQCLVLFKVSLVSTYSLRNVRCQYELTSMTVVDSSVTQSGIITTPCSSWMKAMTIFHSTPPGWIHFLRGTYKHYGYQVLRHN